MNTAKEKISWFLNSSWFISLTTVIALLCYELNLTELTITYLAISAILTLLFTDDATPTFIIPLYAPVLMSRGFVMKTWHWIYFGILIALIVVSIILFVIRQFKVNKHKFKTGKMFWAGIGLCILGVIAGVGYPGFAYKWWWRQILYPIVLTMYYLFFINFTKGNNKRFVAKSFLGMSCFIMLQMLWCILASSDPVALIMSKKILIGSSHMINLAGTMLAMTIPFCFYLANNSKRDWLYCLIGIFIYIFLLFTNSRGNILFATLILPVAFIVSMVKTHNKKRYFVILICASVVIVTGIIFAIIHSDIFFSMLKKIGLSANGRIPVWKNAWDNFLKAPILGTGYYTTTQFMYFPAAVYSYHSTLIQVLSCTGVVGCVFWGYYYFKKFKTFFTNISLYKIFAFLSVLSLELYGLIDMVGVLPSTILFTLIIVVSSENEEDIEPVKSVKEELVAFKAEMKELAGGLKDRFQNTKDKKTKCKT